MSLSVDNNFPYVSQIITKTVFTFIKLILYIFYVIFLEMYFFCFVLFNLIDLYW